MTLEDIRAAFGWCTLINWGILLFWLIMLTGARGLVHRMHSKMFGVSEQAFNAMHYGGMGLFKLGIMLLNFAPYIALRIVG